MTNLALFNLVVLVMNNYSFIILQSCFFHAHLIFVNETNHENEIHQKLVFTKFLIHLIVVLITTFDVATAASVGHSPAWRYSSVIDLF